MNGCRITLRTVKLGILRQVVCNLLGRQFDMIFIILSYMLYGIRLVNFVEIYSCLSEYYCPEVYVELRM